MNVVARAVPLMAAWCLAALLAGCGKTGALYLPERGGEVVTRPAQTPPATSPGDTANSPQTVDTPAAPANPAPEVTPPASTEPAAEKKDPNKKKDGATPPPPHEND
jgi:predicted small lipoprotein YifL